MYAFMYVFKKINKVNRYIKKLQKYHEMTGNNCPDQRNVSPVATMLI